MLKTPKKLKLATLLLLASTSVAARPITSADLDTGDYSFHGSLGGSNHHGNVELGFTVNKEFDNYRGTLGIFVTGEGTNQEQLVDINLEKKFEHNYSFGLGAGFGEQTMFTPAEDRPLTRRAFVGFYIKSKLRKKINDKTALFLQFKRNYFDQKEYHEKGRNKLNFGIEIKLQ
jgi:hypothetical protein